MLHVTLKCCRLDGTAGRRRNGAPPGRAGLAVLIFASGCIAAFLGEARIASAHGVVGQRFFPATLSTDDPFVADEVSLPTVSHRKTSVDPSVKETNIDFDFAKRAGDLPETMNWLRPLAVTGTLGYSIPTRGHTSTVVVDPDTGDVSLDIERHSNAIQYGLAVEYSVPYLTANIQDLGLPSWMNRLTPLVEFSFTQPVDSRFGEQTTGTINPGIIWSGQTMQLGIEAIIPMTRATGKNVGLIAQVHFYLDDLLPQTLGRPLFGGR